MNTYSIPGVYIENVRDASPPIQGVGTSTALCVAPFPGAKAAMNTPLSITNMTQFLEQFGSDKPEAQDAINSVTGFFQNGGTKIYVIAVADALGVIGDAAKGTGIWAAKALDEPAIVITPGVTDIRVQQAVLSYCTEMRDRFYIMDAPKDVTDLSLLTKVATASAAKPSARDPKDEKDGGAPKGDVVFGGGLKPAVSEQGFGGFYFPWVYGTDRLTKKVRPMPPSGFVAGMFARVDTQRGVHKAPANELLRGVMGTYHKVPRAELGMLNNAGVNVIREFPTRGVRVFGARTLADQSSEWKYVNVKRFLIFVEESLQQGLMSAVFQPNDRFTRDGLKMQLRAFLLGQMRAGALVGATPEEAFFVKCDDENNPPDSVAQGRLVCDVGLAVVRPAEFVIIRLSQWTGPSAGSDA